MKVKYISYLVIAFLGIQLNAMQDAGDHRGNDSSRRNNMNQWGIWVKGGEISGGVQVDYKAMQVQQYKKYLSEVEKAIQEKTVNSKPYLAEACLYGWNDIAKLLIKNGAGLEQPEELVLGTPLSCAFGKTKEKIELVDLLLNCGAKIKKGMLSRACSEGYVDVVKLLLEKGAGSFVNEIEDSGSTPLTLAILHVDWNHVKQYQLVKLLISYGADTSINEYENKELFARVINFLGSFNQKSQELEDYFSSKSEKMPDLDMELLEVFFTRLVCLGKFDCLIKFINAYRKDIVNLPEELKLITKFMVKLYRSNFNDIVVKSILVGKLDYDSEVGNKLDWQVYNIAKNKGFKKLGQLIRTTCLLDNSDMPNDTKKLISTF